MNQSLCGVLLCCGLMSSALPSAAQSSSLTLTPENIEAVIQAMTLDEKIDLIVGIGGNVSSEATATVGSQAELVPGAAGQTNPVARLGITPMVLADGPAGLRIRPTRPNDPNTYYCTHFPVEMALSSTWNPDLVRSVGVAMGDEVKRYGADILLAPATNIHRNPLNGRNFEYYSEDPLLAGKMCAAMIQGVQQNGVGTSLKHLALNNQETNRTSNNVIGSPRTFREIYLKPFEIAVKEAQPWTVMTSYNKINGTMSSERADLVTDILRDEWGFQGMVMTDWFGGQNATAQMLAGNDMLQPGKKQQRDEIKTAVLNGRLPREIIDRNVRHILECVVRTPRFLGYEAENNPDLKAHADITRKAATEGMVLLKNIKKTLPIKPGVKNVAVFGCPSYDFIAGGTGSGDVNHAYVVSLIEGLNNAGLNVDSDISGLYGEYIPAAKAALPKDSSRYAAFLPKKAVPEMNLAGINLRDAAKTNDLALITIGKTSGEFIDRRLDDNYTPTAAEIKLVKEVCEAFHKAGKKAVVVLNVCGVIDTRSWISWPDAVLVAWLPGQEGGNSVADVLTGKESPSGRLPMTWPLAFSDVPSSDNFPIVDNMTVEDIFSPIENHADRRTEGLRKNFDYTDYNEGIYVGYRHFTTRDIPVAFPFGFGLSYTDFGYSGMKASKENNGDITVSVDVKNKGKVAGKEVVQVYVAAPGKTIDTPARELKAFAKTSLLEPGQTETVSLTIPYADLASFHEDSSSWQVEEGDYTVMVARNAADKSPLSAIVAQAGSVTEAVEPCLNIEIK